MFGVFSLIFSSLIKACLSFCQKKKKRGSASIKITTDGWKTQLFTVKVEVCIRQCSPGVCSGFRIHYLTSIVQSPARVMFKCGLEKYLRQGFTCYVSMIQP